MESYTCKQNISEDKDIRIFVIVDAVGLRIAPYKFAVSVKARWNDTNLGWGTEKFLTQPIPEM